MKALMRISPKAYDMKVEEISEPIIEKDDWVKVKVAYCGVCGSDIKMMKADSVGYYAKIKPPVVLGHEASGVVVQVGKKVTRAKVGDRVTYETTIGNCGACRFCHSGDWNMCSSRKGLGSSINGSFAEYVIMPERNLRILPNNVSLKAAALTEPLACAYHIVAETGNLRQGESIVISGPGTIGICCAIVALAIGAKVIMIGTQHSKHRLKVAEDMGCITLTNDQEDIQDIVKDILNGELADMAVDAIGSNAAFDMILHLVRKMGRVVIGGAPWQKPDPYSLDMSWFYRHQLTMKAAASTKPASWTGALKILEEYPERLEQLATHVFPIDRWEEAFKVTEMKEAFKAMIAFEVEDTI